jgi:hypothetical protein
VVSAVAHERAGQELNNIIREEVSRQVKLAIKQQEGTIREEVGSENTAGCAGVITDYSIHRIR